MNSKFVMKSKDLFLIGFLFFYFLYRALFDSKLETELDIIVLMASALAGIITIGLNKRIRYHALIRYLLAGIFILFVFHQFHFSDTRLFMLYLSGLSLANEDETHVVKILFVSRIILILIIIFLGGFAQRNGIGSNVGNVALLYMCLDEEQFSIKKWFAIFMVLVALAFINLENAGVLVILSVVLLLQIVRKFNAGKKFLCSKFTMFIYPTCLLVTCYLSASIRVGEMPVIGSLFPASFNNFYLNFVKRLNLVLGTRLSLSKTALDRIGIHLLGGDYFASGYRQLSMEAANRSGYFMVDSGYILLLLRWGILVTILICVISMITMGYFINKRAYNFIIAGIAFALWAILEDSLFYSFILMFWGRAYKEFCYMKKE